MILYKMKSRIQMIIQILFNDIKLQQASNKIM